MVLHSVERDVPTILQRWAYQIIPADDAEPIRTCVAMMSDTPDYYELRQIVEPHLGRFPTPNRILGELINLREVDGSERDMFAEEPYGHDAKGLPRNRRATKLLLRGETFKGFVAGTAVLFEERVVL